jgi:RAB6A-GEF complex partner protein 2
VAGRPPGIATLPSTPSTHKASSSRRKGSASFPQNFKFPTSPLSMADHRFKEQSNRDAEIISPRTIQAPSKLLSPRSREDIPIIKEQSSSLTKIMSPTVNGETPRSSGEFYSLSNNSTETLASEYLPQQPGRIQQRGIHARRISNIATITQHNAPETLMMGYAQIHGSFTLDGSLVNQAPFEEVKRKGVLSGQGGGVVGVETSKRDSGLLRGFGWGTIGESLGGLLSGGELSSIKDMRGIASSKSVPILSTPQSILFVDLRLAPGESRSYNYAFRLPRGLPPSYRGKAIKILYNLVIGTQRPGGTKEQQIKSVEVPFRILGSVNDYGELLGHDLMSPYIVLRDQARVKCLDDVTPGSKICPQPLKPIKSTEPTQSNQDDFLAYVDDLLARPRQNSSLGLLSPTDTRASRRPSYVTDPASAKEAIDLAIMRSNLATDSQQSANRFEISRNGRRVAVIMLTRPAYRLGETITAAIEFTGAGIPCYALHASLETSERVDGAIALRSDTSIRRVTRKIHASHSEVTLFASRIVFTPTIPSTATPSFITSGVSMDWKIVIEFVTPRFEPREDSEVAYDPELVEEISKDDRGVILAAVEGIECETFEVVVPLQVYGALVGITEKDEVKGLVV